MTYVKKGQRKIKQNVHRLSKEFTPQFVEGSEETVLRVKIEGMWCYKLFIVREEDGLVLYDGWYSVDYIINKIPECRAETKGRLQARLHDIRTCKSRLMTAWEAITLPKLGKLAPSKPNRSMPPAVRYPAYYVKGPFTQFMMLWPPGSLAHKARPMGSKDIRLIARPAG